MLFNSIQFALFFYIVIGLYLWLPHRAQNRMLLAASYFFYGWWDHRFLFLLATSTVVDFFAGLMISEGRVSRRQRATASAWLVGGAFFLLVVDWAAAADLILRRNADLAALVRAPAWAWQVLGLTAGVMALANLAYPALQRLDAVLRRRVFLVLSVVTNLGILGVFKYFDFFADSLAVALENAGLDASSFRLALILPVGISFYTFQTMSYALDVYRGDCKPTHSFLDFALFVSFFPQLVAGPIERASRLLPQIVAPRQVTAEMWSRGTFLILFGLFKKVAIADGVAASVDIVYQGTGAETGADVALATLLFAVQIYCDFSGYTDIARGTAKLMGIELMTNFNLPYFSRNPSEFWRRWHISLSTWLRDYLYIPLGGNRISGRRTYVNLMITMLLGGLWHGAAWNFVLWGAYQGSLLSVHRGFFRERAPRRGKIAAAATTIGFFVLVCYGWLLFRATSWNQIVSFTGKLVLDVGSGLSTFQAPTWSTMLSIAVLVAAELCERFSGDVTYYRTLPIPARSLAYALMFVLILFGTGNDQAQFIYFQF